MCLNLIPISTDCFTIGGISGIFPGLDTWPASLTTAVECGQRARIYPMQIVPFEALGPTNYSADRSVFVPTLARL